MGTTLLISIITAAILVNTSPYAKLQKAFNKFHLKGFIYLDEHNDIWEYDTTPLGKGDRKISVPKHRCKKIYIRYIGTGSKKEAIREFVEYLLKVD